MIMLDICCLMVCTVQGYFAVKLLRCSEGEERYSAFVFMKFVRVRSCQVFLVKSMAMEK